MTKLLPARRLRSTPTFPAPQPRNLPFSQPRTQSFSPCLLYLDWAAIVQFIELRVFCPWEPSPRAALLPAPRSPLAGAGRGPLPSATRRACGTTCSGARASPAQPPAPTVLARANPDGHPGTGASAGKLHSGRAGEHRVRRQSEHGPAGRIRRRETKGAHAHSPPAHSFLHAALGRGPALQGKGNRLLTR